MKIELEFETSQELTALLAGTLVSLYKPAEAVFILEAAKCAVNEASPFNDVYERPVACEAVNQ